ncbi:MAG: prepilin-type N-terminal cleavage/methylation domain-containing protein, partial [Candidatus Omnitrophota bacterium]
MRLSAEAVILKWRAMRKVKAFTPLEKEEQFGRGSKPLPNFLTGFTLMELIIVMTVIAIIAALTFPNFLNTKEKALNNQAQAMLKLIQAAQKVNYTEANSYVDCSGGFAGDQESCINTNLRLSLTPNGNNPNWDYRTDTNGCADCQRRGALTTWHICIDDEDISAGTCP